MLRALCLCLALAPGPALAWTFSPDPVCTLAHDDPAVRIVVIHDPGPGDYAITLTLTGAVWPESPAFHITFQGPRPLTIGTGSHALSDDRRSLTVRDTGFGNVLNGLEFNADALAFAGDRRVPFSLSGAADPVRAFRTCARGLMLS
jgi:hypothetical protein